MDRADSCSLALLQPNHTESDGLLASVNPHQFRRALERSTYNRALMPAFRERNRLAFGDAENKKTALRLPPGLVGHTVAMQILPPLVA